MSHGKRMLEAQAQKERSSTTRDDGRVDDGHLRNTNRAFNNDGTPVRSGQRGAGGSSGRRSGEEGEGAALDAQGRHLDPSPPPRPGMQPSREEGGTRRRSEQRSVRKSLSTPQVSLGQAQRVGAGTPEENSRGRRQGEAEAETEQRGTARQIDVDADALSGSDDDDAREAPEALTAGGRIPEKEFSRAARPSGFEGRRSRERNEAQPNPWSSQEGEGRKRGSGSASQGGSAPRYPADRIHLQDARTAVSPPRPASSSPPNTGDSSWTPPVTSRPTAPPPPPLTVTATGSASSRSSASCTPVAGTTQDERRSRTPSRSPPSVTLTKTSLAGFRPAPPQRPITAALHPPSTTPNEDNTTNRNYRASAEAAVPAESHSSQGRRPPPLSPPDPSVSSLCKLMSTAASTTTTTAAPAAPQPLLHISPASPPLRAGVSPRMLPRHPTRFDPSATASFSASRAASMSNTMLPSPSLSQQQEQQQPSSQSSPYDAQQQEYLVRVRSESFSTAPQADSEDPAQVNEEEKTHPSGAYRGFAPKRSGETHMPAAGDDGWRSIPPSPLPSTLPSDGFVATLSPAAAAPDTSHTLPSMAPTDGVSTGESTAQPPLPAPAFSNDAPISPSSLLPSSPHQEHCRYLRDFSGFHNAGNDCYGCSALTMLLRSTVLRRALLCSPLVTAVRRYESLLARRPERRVQWTSGYVDTLTPQETKKCKKRRRSEKEAAEEEGMVAEVCGLPSLLLSDTTATQADMPISDGPTSAVQQTLDLVETLTLEELESVLRVDLETGCIPVTLHAALAALARAVRWREHMTAVINASSTSPAERRWLLEEKIYHENDRLFDGQVYTYGIRLSAVAALFQGEFFLGEQEDAHELFVALMAKLEAEAVDFQKGCTEVQEERQRAAHRYDHEGEQEREEAVMADRTAAVVMTVESATSSPVVPGVSTPPPTPAISTAMADAWINSLVQARLLNIIRCRSPGCQHEIVTDEICVNLSLHIPEQDGEDVKTERNRGQQQQQQHLQSSSAKAEHTADPDHPLPAEEKRDYFFFLPHMKSTTSLPQPAPTETPPTAVTTRPSPPCSVAALLHHSMAFEPLSDYRCDVCGSKTAQYQGGCFYTRPPPVLVLQLKRFSTDFVDGALRIQKNSRPVAVGDTLVTYALPSTEEEEERRRRQGRQPLRTVALAEVAADMQGCEVTNSQGSTAVAAAAAHAQCFFYNAEDKRFTCISQSPSHETPASTDSGETTAAEWVTAIRSVYRLRSCVLHLGSSLHFGHYVSDFAVDGEKVEDEGEGETKNAGNTRHYSSAESAENIAAERRVTVTPWITGGAASSAVAHSIRDSAADHASLHRRWRRANDERVEVLDEAAVRTRRVGHANVYLLLYEKVAEEWVRCPLDAVLPRPVYPAEEAQDKKDDAAE
ncbi:putative ubiquitin hydrolase putativecysteine peptidase Clan CA family C19 [Leptomonas pyrrhocoris]|uniref:ubiquitinyl hydrolase 1 n=1 Tax=Leptomonas pyrrhocoris TaxID=157538 RepID=A0A0M9FUB4_LEPPY|nr:putative ubiquitin hydrolase putativecysteine peptidase Clan CA family C19 [Leptomonas pyrrhocoris]KPA76245.1 putative ubiquitin hydrolase putativecysteine peptidase Clan CA family C19 [Leptomonas pyrrhocoris]|eukprot:XP_015654684.1 putative ubiquitin hydrolase putativecysteine peptidase Clan CA family C19 [Leptomonas pyrrhocoris]